MVERRITGPVNNPGRAGIGLVSVQAFTSNDTWTKPSGIVLIRVQVVGGGGGGGTGAITDRSSSGGGGGGYAEELIDVTAITSETVTVGAGATAGNTGGTSSLGSLLSATGGVGGAASAAAGGAGGAGSGGDINANGQGGGAGSIDVNSNFDPSFGGASYFGAGAPARAPTRGSGIAGTAFGGGGGGGIHSTGTGGSGFAGVVIVWEYV